MTKGTAPDPTQHSKWRPLRLLQDAMDADIAKVYAEARTILRMSVDPRYRMSWSSRLVQSARESEQL